MSDEIVVKASDLRTLGYCIPGTKAFFAKHGLNWKLFVKDGLPASTLEATGDAMALKIVEVVRGRR